LSGTIPSERLFTVYDYPENNLGLSIQIPASLSLNNVAPNYSQRNLEGNVVITYRESTAAPDSIETMTWYSYDAYRRIEWVAQYINGIEGQGNSLTAKTIDYEFDHKGNLNKVIYQKNTNAERFTHRYTYDSNGVTIKVETASGNNPFTTDADYAYYQTGELKRHNVAAGAQGLDYVYTLGGRLKSINHPSLETTKDPGKDGLPGGQNAGVVPDLFGIVLDYYMGDYSRIGTSISTSPAITPDYAGNIKAARWSNKNSMMDWPSGSTTAQQKAYQYSYDRNNYLTGAIFGRANASGNIVPDATYPNQHRELGMEYDPNGNITKLQRTNNIGATVDNLTYNYTNTGSNQLNSLTDAVLNTAYANDIDPQASGNYVYNALGQLILNKQETIHYQYNAQGLVTEVRKGNLIFASAFPVARFYYNEQGQRVKKDNFITGTSTLTSTDYYVSDLSGNLMSVYTRLNSNPSLVVQKELPIYGATRLGVCLKAQAPNPEIKNYEITDHLGNVRAVFQRTANPYPNNVAMNSYADYYPFGEQLIGRSSNSGYRFAFQGQELDPSTGMEAFQLRLWDGRIGRWLSPDPYGQHFSPYLGMGNNPVTTVDPDGGWETKFGRFLGWVSNGFRGSFTDNPDHATPNRRYGLRDTGTYTEEDGVVGVYIWTAFGGEKNIPSSKTITPFEVGTEWLSGKGPRDRYFTNGDVFTEMLRKHSKVSETRSIIINNIQNDGDLQGKNNYELGGIKGVGLYLKDYSTLATGGLTGNLAVTYLGSYSLHWKVTNINRSTGIATVQFSVDNSSTMQSASRPPILGYLPIWQESAGKYINDKFATGWGSKTSQHFNWTENLVIQ
jgi:RHS repeat-associated protein